MRYAPAFGALIVIAFCIWVVVETLKGDRPRPRPKGFVEAWSDLHDAIEAFKQAVYEALPAPIRRLFR